MALPSAVVEQSTSKVFSVISTKLDERASRAETIARIEIAVRRIRAIVEKTGKIAITSASLLDDWNLLKQKYMEGMALLNKYKPRQEQDGQVVVRSSSYFHGFAKRAASLSFSSLVGLVKEELSPCVAQIFEWYADWAETSFVAQVESCCPLRLDTSRYPFLTQLFQGKTLYYAMMKGKKQLAFYVWPVILEGRGVEALLLYNYVDPERLKKGFFTMLMLRISESTDIVGAAIKCLRSSASLLSPVAQDAAAQLTQLHYFQDIADFYLPPSADFHEWYPECTKIYRSDPLCCQAGNGHEPSNSIISSELSQMFPEQTIFFAFQCIVPMLECKLGTTSSEAHSKAMVNRRSRPQPLMIRSFFAPHLLLPCMLQANSSIDMTVTKKEGCTDVRKPDNNINNIQEYFDWARLAAINSLTDEPEATECTVDWITTHGFVWLAVEKPPQDIVSAPKASGRYKTRSTKKRKM